MHRNIGCEWLGKKLGVSADDIRLYKDTDDNRGLERSEDEKRMYAESPEFMHPRLGKIVFGPRNIILESEENPDILENCGYETDEYKEWLARQ